ncbi:MAG: alpha/beta hydrolase-fold protein, partial [Deinococcota bacterium]|nr:alpha/beta hydrolase-fold protein [Deinococcota bacterium]
MDAGLGVNSTTKDPTVLPTVPVHPPQRATIRIRLLDALNGVAPNSPQLESAKPPLLEVRHASGLSRVAFSRAGQEPGWLAEFTLPAGGDCRFRVDLGGGLYDHDGAYHQARLTPGPRTLWLQGGEIFDYRPQPDLSPSRVVKIPEFGESLPGRALYLYLPRGYHEHKERRYPVLYMHDGQNCFEAFVSDSYSGSWGADRVADMLISQGRMRECLIVGVANGGPARLAEYLPPYTAFVPPPKRKRARGKRAKPVAPLLGRADTTLAYYKGEVASYLSAHYRVLTGREHTATCGSSMGGLFSTYIAWEHPDFARHHAVMSPSYWITRTPEGVLEAVERLRGEPPRDVRLWLDSGTLDAPGRG